MLRRLSNAVAKACPLRDPSALAEPWRRLGAAALDTSLLLMAQALVLLLIFARSSEASISLGAFAWITPLACWIYVWVGWSLGTTIGMWIFGIRLLRLDTENGGTLTRPGPLCAARRIAGYMLACIPVKGGLFPIFTHPARQGWHDQIARTVVIKTGPAWHALDFAPVRQEIRIHPPSPQLRVLKRDLLMPILLYLAIALIFGRSILPHFGTEMAGLGGDSSLFAWDYWHVFDSLQNHRPLLTTNMAFFPQVVPLYYHTMDWFNSFVASVLLLKLGMVATYNVLWFASLALSAFCTYVLLYSVSSNRNASMAIAPVFGLSPFFLVHGLGHMDIISAEFLPLFLLLAYAGLTKRKVWICVCAGIALALAGLCDFQQIIFGCVLLIGLFIGFWWKPRSMELPEIIEHVKLIVVILATGAVLLCPLVIPMVLASPPGHEFNQSGEAGAFKADPLDFVCVSGMSELARGMGLEQTVYKVPIETTLTPGIAVLLLACYAMLRSFKKLFVWYAAGLAAIILACGPFLTFHGYSPSPLISVALLGFPGNAFSQPFDFHEFLFGAQLLVAAPSRFLTAGVELRLPFEYVQNAFPMFNAFRVPARIGMCFLLCAGVLATFGLSDVMDSAAKRFGKIGSLAVCVAVLLLVIGEYFPAYYATWKAPISPFYAVIARDAPMHPVVNLPLGPYPANDFDPTVHHQPVFALFISRTPAYAYKLIFGNPFLGYCATFGTIHAPIVATRAAQSASDQRAGLAQLQMLGVRYVIVHKNEVPESSVRTADREFTTKLGMREVWDDRYVRVYCLPGVQSNAMPDGGTRGNAQSPAEMSRSK